MPFNPAEPNAQLYGIIPQMYAQSLATSTGDPTADAINRLNLGGHARMGAGNMRGYEDLIAQANQMGYQAEMGDQQTRRDTAYYGAIPQMVQAGVGGAVLPGQNTGLQIDQRRLAQGDAAAMQAQQAKILENVAQATDAAAGADLQFDPKMLAGVLTSPWSNVIAPAPTPFVTTENKADMIRANNDTIKANASMVSARKPPGGGSDGKTKTEENQVWDPVKKKWIVISRTVKTDGNGGNQAPAEAKDDTDDTKTTVRERKYIKDANGEYVKNPNYKGK